jgi:hypothetical protein
MSGHQVMQQFMIGLNYKHSTTTSSLETFAVLLKLLLCIKILASPSRLLYEADYKLLHHLVWWGGNELLSQAVSLHRMCRICYSRQRVLSSASLSLSAVLRDPT